MFLDTMLRQPNNRGIQPVLQVCSGGWEMGMPTWRSRVFLPVFGQRDEGENGEVEGAVLG